MGVGGYLILGPFSRDYGTDLRGFAHGTTCEAPGRKEYVIPWSQ